MKDQMTIGDVIDVLMAAKAEHGDVPVYVYTPSGDDTVPVTGKIVQYCSDVFYDCTYQVGFILDPFGERE